MKCHFCGQEIPEEARFCAFCGKEVSKKRKCARCGAELMENAAFCMECGSKITGEDSGMKQDDKAKSRDGNPALEKEELEEFRKNVKCMISEYIKMYGAGILEYIETQKDVIWTGNSLIDLRDLSVIKELKKQIDALYDGRTMSSNTWAVWLVCWHQVWPQWKRYYREIDYEVNWVGKIVDSVFYYITGGDRSGYHSGSPNKNAVLHKCAMGTESEEDIKTWNTVEVYKDQAENIRIIATNKTRDGYELTDGWILLNDSGEVLWESEERLDCLNIYQKGWGMDYLSNDPHNSSLLLDFYTGKILLKGYCFYKYYELKGQILIEASKFYGEGSLSRFYFYYENGKAVEAKGIHPSRLKSKDSILREIDAKEIFRISKAGKVIQ